MVGLLCLFIAYNHNSSQTYIFKGQAYGTSWTVTTTSYLNDTHKSSIKKIINRVDYVASNYKENSEIALINLLGDSQEINISLDLYEILDIANEITLLTDGAYDIKLGKYSSSFGFAPSFNKDLSSSGDPSFTLNKSNLTLNKEGGFWFDLSSVAKGYAVDEIVKYLELNNFNNYIVEIGGELTVKGFNHSDSWLLAIQDPSKIDQGVGQLITNINGEKISIATSGEYRNYNFSSEGKKVTHTINPATKLSINNDALSVTVISKQSAAHADALATAFNVMTTNSAIKIANENNLAVLFIVQDSDYLNFIYTDAWYYSKYE